MVVKKNGKLSLEKKLVISESLSPPPLKESLPKTTKEQPESNEYN